MLDEPTAAVVVQQPNFFGCSGGRARPSASWPGKHGALLIVGTTDPLRSGCWQPPGAYGADIAVGEGQPLGNPLSFGGPYLGFFAAKDELRAAHSRAASWARRWTATGTPGYVLTLQTREQHIRREQATSNICTNQALIALTAAVYLTLLGKRGRAATSPSSRLHKAHYAAATPVARCPGSSRRGSAPFFHEFVVRTDRRIPRS